METKDNTMICDEMTRQIIDVAEKLAVSEGAYSVTVRKILEELGITNRVFYNRFHNIAEVLDVVYENMVHKIREGITAKFSPEEDFFEQVTDIVAETLVMSYEIKMNFNYYVFENDSVSNENYEWWKAQIKGIIEFGISRGHLRELDTEKMSYAIWCFIRGYNADALGRKIPREEAVGNFKYCFGVLLDGMKKK